MARIGLEAGCIMAVDAPRRAPIGDAGEVIAVEPERKLVLSWRNEFKPEMRAEGHSRI